MLGDPAHWLFEIVSGGIFLAIGATWHALWQRGHDRDHHQYPPWKQYAPTIKITGSSFGESDPRRRRARAMGLDPTTLSLDELNALYENPPDQ